MHREKMTKVAVGKKKTGGGKDGVNHIDRNTAPLAPNPGRPIGGAAIRRSGK